MGRLAALVVVGVLSAGTARAATLDIEALERLKKRSEAPTSDAAVLQPKVCQLAPKGKQGPKKTIMIRHLRDHSSRLQRETGVEMVAVRLPR